MDYTVNTTIAGPSAGSPDVIYQWAVNAGCQRPADVHQYLQEVYRLCGIAGLRAEVVVAQSIHETSDVTTGAPWASSWWVDRCNPAGMGVTGDPTQNDASPTFANGTAAAQAHVVHLFLYAVGATLPAGIPQDWDPRWQAAIDAGYAGIAPTIQGLQNTWGMDNNYANALLGRLIALSKVMGTAPATTPPAQGTGTVATPAPVRGHVPRPPWISQYDIGNNHNIGTGRSDDAPRAGFIVGSCVHTSQGTFAGNLESFSDPTFGGLTDAQIGGPWDGGNDGVIMVFIDPASQVIPWANGGVGPNCDGCVAPHGDGPAYLSQFGSSGGIDWVVNGRLRSVETTDGGDPTVTKGGRQIESLCFLLAYWHSEQAGQSWDQFAWRMSHWEFGGAHQQCPGDWIKAHEKDINDRTQAIMKAYQTGTALNPPLQVTYPPNWTGGAVPLPGTTPAPQPAPAPAPAYTPAAKPAFWDQLQKDGMYVDRGTVWFSSHESYTAQKATPRYTYAATASTLRAGAPLNQGDVINPNNEEIAVGTSASGGQWVIDHDPDFTRFTLADFKP